jgi:hypothetical protein
LDSGAFNAIRAQDENVRSIATHPDWRGLTDRETIAALQVEVVMLSLHERAMLTRWIEALPGRRKR